MQEVQAIAHQDTGNSATEPLVLVQALEQGERALREKPPAPVVRRDAPETRQRQRVTPESYD